MGVKWEDRPTYAQAAWDDFCRLAGIQRIISPAEFVLIQGWMDEGIPLAVVLRAFGEFQGKPRRLEAMDKPVRRAYEYWFQAMGGLPSGTEDYV